MTDLFIRGSLIINPGKLNEFVDVAEKMIAIHRSRDQRTIAFDTYLDEGNSLWVALERYPDSEGLMQHWANQDPELKARLMTLCRPGDAEMFGSPSQAVLDRARVYATRVFKPLHSLRS